MEKGDRIYIVKAEGTLDDGAKAFINYPDAREYAENWAYTIAGDTISELGDEDKVRTTIKQDTKVEEGKEPNTKVPFEIEVFADTYDEDYCIIQVIKTELN